MDLPASGGIHGRRQLKGVGGAGVVDGRGGADRAGGGQLRYHTQLG